MAGISATKRSGGIGATALAVAIAIALGAPGAAQAGERTASFKPAAKSERALFFKLRGVRPERIVGAEATLRGGRGQGKRVEHRLNPRRVRAVARRGGMLRVRKPRSVRRGRLRLKLQPKSPTGSAGGASCAFAGVTSCTVLKQDDGTASDPRALWGDNIYCADSTRHQVVDGYRRITVLDGDDVWGERCELALNDHRYGMSGENGTFALYREGERAITSMRVRLGDSFPLDSDFWSWQVIAQMKQAQPSDNGGGTPILSLSAVNGEWRLHRSTTATGTSGKSEQLWSTPAQKNTWTQIAFDVTYSQDASVGKVKLFVDANGDGDPLDAGEQSPVINTYTLKRETASDPSDGLSNDGIAEGESIPSHLRIGIYHDPALECPPPGGCSADYDDIVVARPN